MDKNAIKKYAVWARRELIARVSGRAAHYGVTEEGWGDTNADSVNGHVLTDTEKRQRIAFIKKVKSEGYEQSIEEVAYTWFNRFCALRYMEVNGYLPSHARVFTNEAGEFKPEIIDEALHLDIEGLDMDKVLSLKEDAQKTEELFRYLLITQCNALNSILPGMFQKIEDYTELLLPENLLREGSVIEQMITQIPEEDWTDQVQIIGWLYQYYIAEPKDKLINARSQYKDEDIPFVTQLFTSDWIVRYMVENSLGRLWEEGHPNDGLKTKWEYYLDEAEQEPEVEAQLAEIRKEYAKLKPEEIKCIDPCCGSGHILCYMVDVLMQIYASYGYTAEEAVSSIIENNLYGLDIDDRAVQLAYFAVMMKARSYDHRFFSRGIQPHVYVIYESNEIDQNAIDYFVGDDPKLKKDFGTLVEELHDAKEYGSILSVTSVDFDALYERVAGVKNDINFYSSAVIEQILPLVQTAEILSHEYDVVVTNPPYMNRSYMPNKLKDYIDQNFPDFKTDLFAVFINSLMRLCRKEGHIGLLTPYVWMFISSYEKMRQWVYQYANISSLVQLEYNAFEAACVPVAAFTLCKTEVRYSGEYVKLSEFKGADVQGPKTREAVINPTCGYRFTAFQDDFIKIPGAPVAYWVGNAVYSSFDGDSILKHTISDGQNKTGDNNKYLRFFWEVKNLNIGVEGKYRFYAKGGNYRKWYGNLEWIINWSEESRKFYKKDKIARLIPEYLWYKDGITWTLLTSSHTGFRFLPSYATFDVTGSSIFIKKEEELPVILALLNSKVSEYFLTIFSQTLAYQITEIRRIPLNDNVFNNAYKINNLCKTCIDLSKSDWDSFETSWDFSCHPLVQSVSTIAEAYAVWEEECKDRFFQLKINEEELNQIFINIYCLQGELTPEEEDKDVTVRKADLQRDIKSLISYAVGCMFGRYSLDVDGIAYAGGEWDPTKYKTYQPDYNGILPICDDEYFTDDIMGHFVDFIRTVYGEDTLEGNLQFIADALGGSGSSREVIRKYFLNDFYADHCKIYQKRPIYWLFDSGKKNGFKCLIYIHRYRPDTIARIRTDYVHEQQARYRTAITDVEKRVTDAPTSDRIKLNKQLKKLQDQSDELLGYEEKIHHLADQFIDIDLDDGVKVNYAKFQDVLAKTK